MAQNETAIPRQVIVKVMTVTKKPDEVFRFFSDVKNMEIGGAIKSVTKSEDDGCWEFDHTVAGKGRMKLEIIPEYGILDHVFAGGGLEWKVYVRIIPNQNGSTTSWTFLRTDGLTDTQFQDQLKGFDMEIKNWVNFLEGRKG